MPKDITRTTTVYEFTELEGTPKETARAALTGILSDHEIITNDMRTTAADWLTNEGWTDLAELRWEENGPDLEKLQFSISFSQGDFVAWSSTRPYDVDGEEITVKTTMRHIGAGTVVMDVNVVDDDGESTYDGSDKADRIEAKANEMVDSHRAKVLSLLHDTDLAYIDGSRDEYLAEFAEANEIVFTANGEIFR